MMRPEHRGKAVGTVQSGWAVGWGAAALLYAVIFSVLPDEIAWRAMFWVGILPALLVLYIRRHVKDSEIFHATRARAKEKGSHFLEIFSPALLGTTIVASLMTTGMMAGYYAVTTWVPTYLKTVRDLSVLNTGAYTVVIIIGSFVGYWSQPTCAIRLAGARPSCCSRCAAPRSQCSTPSCRSATPPCWCSASRSGSSCRAISAA